ncbi:hypothetical protein vseg_001423 [Gypsophila vaccaria]
MAQVLTCEIPVDSNDNTYDSKRKRKNRGKQVIEIKYIENKNARVVTFSKRRKGLFNKTRDLCNTEDAQAAIITISQAGKLYSFGSPSEDLVIRRYINSLNNNGDGNWWDGPVDNLGLEELEGFKAALEGLKNDVITRIDKISRSSMSNVVQNYGINGNKDDRRLGAQVISDFECKKTESFDQQEVIRPELLSADALLNLISIKGLICLRILVIAIFVLKMIMLLEKS